MFEVANSKRAKKYAASRKKDLTLMDLEPRSELEESRNEFKLANALYQQLATLKKREKSLHN